MPKIPASFVVSFAMSVGAASAGCSQAAQSTSSQSSALIADTTADGGVPATLAPCLTTYVECVRALAAGSDAATCRSALHTCAMPAHDGDPAGALGDGGACDGHGGGPRGDGGPGAPPDRGPRPHGDDGDANDVDGGVPPADVGDGGAGGPRACVDALDVCAAGTDTTDVCVEGAVTCFASMPHPPHGGGRGPGGHP